MGIKPLSSLSQELIKEGHETIRSAQRQYNKGNLLIMAGLEIADLEAELKKFKPAKKAARDKRQRVFMFDFTRDITWTTTDGEDD